MAVKRCDNGHFYDDAKFDTCPHCKTGMETSIGSPIDGEKTMSGAMMAQRRAAVQKLVDFGPPSGTGNDEKTVGIFKKKHGQDPVTGWLVCVKGPERGRDYRLHSGRNFLGRAVQMDIAVTDDTQISRENHCSVVYDPKSHTFLLAPGSANTYLNGEAVTDPAQLKTSDIIGIGSSEFVFVPFCNEGRTWED